LFGQHTLSPQRQEVPGRQLEQGSGGVPPSTPVTVTDASALLCCWPA
jgi:hypothetical protein